MLEVNEAFSLVSGFSRDQAIGRTSFELGFWRDPGQRARIIEQLDQQGFIRNVEVLWRLRDGRMHNLLWSADPIEWDGQECLINSVNDISEFKRIQENLLASEEQYRSSMEAAFEPMVVYDLDGKVRNYVNPAFTRVFGWSADETTGKKD